MDSMVFILEFAKIIAWPIILLIIVIFLRKPIADLLPLLKRLKYNDLELWFDQEIDRIGSVIPPEELSQIKEKTDDEYEEIKKLSNTSPSQVLLTSWEKTEQVIYSKLKELFPTTSLQYKRLTSKRAYAELSLTGVLSPSVENLLQDLYFLRNRVSHSPEQTISSKMALKYFNLCKVIQEKIKTLTELPSVKLTPLTLMIYQLNHLLDSGKYPDITVDEIENEIKQESILNYLKEKIGDDIDIGIIMDGTTYPGFVKFYTDNLKSFLDVYGSSTWSIENSGLCLLLALTNEIIQQGSGWHPKEL